VYDACMFARVRVSRGSVDRCLNLKLNYVGVISVPTKESHLVVFTNNSSLCGTKNVIYVTESFRMTQGRFCHHRFKTTKSYWKFSDKPTETHTWQPQVNISQKHLKPWPKQFTWFCA